AEDGIRDDLVTGVQTCALPISEYSESLARNESIILKQFIRVFGCTIPEIDTHYVFKCPIRLRELLPRTSVSPSFLLPEPKCSVRSEERRVGKECIYQK